MQGNQGSLLVSMLAALNDEISDVTGDLLNAQRTMLDAQKRLVSLHQQINALIHTYSRVPDPLHLETEPGDEIRLPASDVAAANLENSETPSASPVARVRAAAEGPSEVIEAPPAASTSDRSGEILDLYAEHAFTEATLAARTGASVGEVATVLFDARERLDARAVKGDQITMDRAAVAPPPPPKPAPAPAAPKPPAQPKPQPAADRKPPPPAPAPAPKTIATQAEPAATLPDAEAKTVAPSDDDIGVQLAFVDYGAGTVSCGLQDTKLVSSWLRVVDRLKDQRVYALAKAVDAGRFVSERVMLQRLPEAQKVLAKVGLTIHLAPNRGMQLRRLAQ